MTNCNVPWTGCSIGYPYGPIWYVLNIPVLLYGWTLPYQVEVWSMVGVTSSILILKKHIVYSMVYAFVGIEFILSGLPFLISSMSILALGMLSPIFTGLSLLDRLPILTSWNFSSSGSLFETTHVERYATFGIWFVVEAVYWIRRFI